MNPCVCNSEAFGRCICSEIIEVKFGKPVAISDRFKAALLLFNTSKVVESFGEVEYAHYFCEFLDEATKKQIFESIAPSNFVDVSHYLVNFNGRFFAHLVSKNNFCVECLSRKEIFKLYCKVVFSKRGGLDSPLTIYREDL